MRVIHPHHPLYGQVVEVLRPYRRQAGESQLDIQLPDGTRVFIPESWAEPVMPSDSSSKSEAERLPRAWVNAETLLALAKLVVAFKTHPDPERKPRDATQPSPARDDP
jgi:hypothetical protein